jgi:hypothetical protein
MLKLTYSLPNDKFRTVTVLGDAEGLFDLWFRLMQARPEHDSHAAANLRITTLSGVEVNPSQGIRELFVYDEPLSRLGA